jgi:hypothetical protein
VYIYIYMTNTIIIEQPKRSEALKKAQQKYRQNNKEKCRIIHNRARVAVYNRQNLETHILKYLRILFKEQ